MKLSRLVVVLLIVLGYGSGVLSVSANPDFITTIQEKGRTFAIEKTTFSTEKPRSKRMPFFVLLTYIRIHRFV